MAIVWADGFDQYGAQAQLAQGGYTASSITFQNTAGNARTGTGYVRGSSVSVLRKALTNPARVIGSGVGIYMESVAVPNNTSCGIHFETVAGSNANRFSIIPNTGLGFTAWVNGAAVGATANNLFTLNAWYWLEVKVTANSGANTNDSIIEVRFQGQTVLTVTGLNVNGNIAFVTLGNVNNFASESIRYDDWVIWDASGTQNNSFIGDRRCLTILPDSDTATADWVPSSGTIGWDRINDVPPTDASYIEGQVAGAVSEFGHGPVTINTNDVAAVVVFGRVAKTDAGTSSFRLGIHSGAFVSNSSELFPGTSFTYFQNIFERDPNGFIPWTKAAVDASKIRITREQ